MTIKLALLTLLATLGLSLQAATPAEEKAFVDAYKKALEAKDAKALKAFLHTDGATAEIIELVSMMQSMASGAKIASIELQALTKEEAAKVGEAQEMPDGKKYKMAVTPIKMLVIASGEASDSAKMRVPVAEVKGKLVIPVPVPVK